MNNTEIYDHGMGIDGFWTLYKEDDVGRLTEVFTVHDDHVPEFFSDKVLSDDDKRLNYLVDLYLISTED